MRVHHSLRLRRRTRREWDRHHVVLVGALCLQSSPSLTAVRLIALQALEHSFIKGAAELALGSIGILWASARIPACFAAEGPYGINDQRNLGVFLLVPIQQIRVLGIHYDSVHLGKVKDISDIILLQAVVHRYDDAS